MPIQPLDDPLNNPQNRPDNNKPEASPWDEVFKPKEAPKDAADSEDKGPKAVEELVPFDSIVSNKKQPEPLKPESPKYEGPKPVQELSPLSHIPPATPPVSAPKPAEPVPGPGNFPKAPVTPSPAASLDEIPEPEKKAADEPRKPYDPYAELEGPWKEIFAKKTPEPQPAPEISATQVDSTPSPLPSTGVTQPPPAAPEKPAAVDAQSGPVQTGGGAKETAAMSPEELVEYYQEQLLYDPEDIETRIKYINAYLEIGLEFELVDDYLALANCYRNQGDVDNAKRYYHKVLELDSTVLEARKKLEAMGEKIEICPAPESPGAPDKYAGAREVKSEKKKVEAPPPIPLTEEEKKKVTELKRMLQLNPINDAAARKLSEIFHSKNRISDAVNEMANLADAYMRRGMYIKAQAIYTDLLKECPSTDLRQRLAKAKTYSRSNNAIEQAIKSYENSLRTRNKPLS
jgi:tetratricopeptide (TPR) repeat protein